MKFEPFYLGHYRNARNVILELGLISENELEHICISPKNFRKRIDLDRSLNCCKVKKL